MKLALLSDAHGNSIGLDACLRCISGLDVDDIYFLGDAVGYLTDPVPVLQRLRDAAVSCQKGNHEAMLLGELPLDPRRDAFYRLSVQREALTGELSERLSAWPRVRELDVGGVRMLLSHGSPAPSLSERVYEDTPWRPDAGFPYDVAFIGHTHRPFVRRCDDVLLVNVGSCGMPRDRGDLASWVLYDTDAREARIYRVPFDVDRALELHGEGVPDEVTAVFERREEFHGTVL